MIIEEKVKKGVITNFCSFLYITLLYSFIEKSRIVALKPGLTKRVLNPTHKLNGLFDGSEF